MERRAAYSLGFLENQENYSQFFLSLASQLSTRSIVLPGWYLVYLQNESPPLTCK